MPQIFLQFVLLLSKSNWKQPDSSVFLVFSACLNVVLDLLFVVKLQMGVAGAGWATNLSQAISAVLCALYIWFKTPDLKPESDQWKLSPQDTKPQLAAGIPMALQFAITASGTMIMQSAINLFGSEAVAAYTAAGKLQNILTQGMVAMGQTMATYGGQNYGCCNLKRIRLGVHAALFAEFIYSMIASATMILLLKPCLHLFFSGDVDMNAMIPWATTYSYMCAPLLSSALHDLYLPKYHARLRIWLSLP